MDKELSGHASWALADAVRALAGEGQSRREGTATYVRTDADGTGWVLLPGTDAPTPVNGATLADASPGQVVSYRIEGGRLSVVGNASDPAAGAGSVRESIERASDAVRRVVLKVQQDVTVVVNGVNGISTLIRQYAGGVLTTKTGNGVGALVNADGSFDVVPVTWQGEVPTAGATLSSFGYHSGANATAMLSDSPAVGVAYALPEDVQALVGIVLDSTLLAEGTDYTESGGGVTLLASQTVADILASSGTAEEDDTEDETAHALNVVYTCEAGGAIALGGPIARPGLDIPVRALFRHASRVTAQHGTAGTDAGFEATRSDTGSSAFFGVGVGGTNHGVFSRLHNRWMVWGDADRVNVAPHRITGGNVELVETGIPATAPASSKWGHSYRVLDAAAATIGYFRGEFLSGNRRGVQMEAERYVGGTRHTNPLDLLLDGSGNQYVRLSRVAWLRALGISAGSVGQDESIAAGSYHNYHVDFPFSYSSVPNVTATIYSTTTDQNYGPLTITVYSRTQTGFDVRIYNNSGTTRSPGFQWVAIGTPVN